MPTFYNYTEDGYVYSFDDVFVPADAFREGNLFTWGRNTNGQLGINNTNTRCTPVTTSTGGANWKQVACAGAGNHTAAIKTDGTLWTWGRGTEGQLGDNTAVSTSTPVQTFTTSTNWKQVSCGTNFTSAIKTDGTLWTWGINSAGELGVNNLTSPRCTPVTTFTGGTNWKQVACGGNHTAAIKTDGTLWTWGGNATFGQLGDNTATDRSTPVQVFGSATNWKQVASGSVHTAAIKTDGTLWTWGYNFYGQLGINNTNTRCTPVQVFGSATNWKQVACGGNHTAAIKTDGTLWTWGRNSNGQLGTGGADKPTPVQVASVTNWKQVSCSNLNTAAIKTDGTLWTWGVNSYGQLGVNDTTQRNTPVTTFAGGTIWKQVSCGTNHIAAVTYIDSYQ